MHGQNHIKSLDTLLFDTNISFRDGKQTFVIVFISIFGQGIPGLLYSNK